MKMMKEIIRLILTIFTINCIITSNATQLGNRAITTLLGNPAKAILLDDPEKETPLDKIAKKKPLDSSTKKTSLDRPVQNRPLDSPAKKTPLDSATKKTPLDNPAKKGPLDIPAKTTLAGNTISTKNVTAVPAVLCQLDCRLPDFLKVVCDPLKPYLFCNEEVLEKFKGLEKLQPALKCYCMWRTVFNSGNVNKKAYGKIVDYTPYNMTKKIRIRMSSLGRECQMFTSFLCDGRLREAENRLFSKEKDFILGATGLDRKNFSIARVFLYEDGWAMFASKLKNQDQTVSQSNFNQEQNKTRIDIYFSCFNDAMLKWFAVGGGVVIPLILVFFIARARLSKSKVEGNPGLHGSLDMDGLSPDRHDTSWEAFSKKRRYSKLRKDTNERERLLSEKTYAPALNSPLSSSTPKKVPRKNKKTSKEEIPLLEKSKDNLDSGEGINKASQCDSSSATGVDITLALTSVSEENAQAQTLTKISLADSDSEGEEAKLFHSSLMYGKGRNVTKNQSKTGETSKTK